MSLNELNAAIDAIDRITDDTWKAGLVPRKLKELEFHDRARSYESVSARKAEDTYEKFYGNKKYYSVVQRSFGYLDEWISTNASGRIVLDYACGEGDNALKAAKAGALLSLGFDISGVAVKNAQVNAAQAGLANTRFFQADAENTKLPDNCIDTLICSGMLHHLDLSYAFPEMRRILKPGGKVLAIEALDYNPLIKIYRALTPEMRTEWEKSHILSLRDIVFAKRFFSVPEIKYWHVTGYAAGKFPILRTPLDTLDRVLEKIPLVQRLAWIFTFEMVKE